MAKLTDEQKKGLSEIIALALFVLILIAPMILGLTFLFVVTHFIRKFW